MIVLAVLAAAQASRVAGVVATDVAYAFETRPRFLHAGPQGAAPNFAFSAYRTLPRVADRIPADSRVLLVSGSPVPWIPWEFYFMPRRFGYLQTFDPAHLAVVRARLPLLAEVAESTFAKIEERGHILTPQRLVESLAATDYVVTFFYDARLPAEGLELVVALEETRLFRVGRGDGR